MYIYVFSRRTKNTLTYEIARTTSHVSFVADLSAIEEEVLSVTREAFDVRLRRTGVRQDERKRERERENQQRVRRDAARRRRPTGVTASHASGDTLARTENKLHLGPEQQVAPAAYGLKKSFSPASPYVRADKRAAAQLRATHST